MNKNIFSFLFSTRLMALLFIVYAAAMAAGTFIESAYNTDTARIWIYNAWWFEVIHVFFLINFFGNIKRYQLHKKEKWATLLLHLAFIFILIGAGITRYISYEGVMPIQEGESSKQFYSDKSFLTLFVDGDYKGQMKRKTYEKPLLLSPKANSYFELEDDFNEIPFQITFQEFILDAKESIKPSPTGKFHLKLVESSDGSRHEHFLVEGEIQNIHNVLITLNKPTKGAINIVTDGTTTTLQAPFEGGFMRMADKFQGKVDKEIQQPLMFRSLYNLANAQFVFPDQPVKGVQELVSSSNFKAKEGNDALRVLVTSQGKSESVTLVGTKGKQGEPKNFKIGKLDFTLAFGSKLYELPFAIKLNDFIAKKYPGTEKSYSSYESKVTVQDPKKSFDADIYMNHILDHGGYRFFQASFSPDEKGTVLSVNHDYWGTLITYIGYFLLFFAMMAILFDKNTRFNDVKRKLDAVKKQKEKLLLLLFVLCSFSLQAQDHDGHAHQAKPAAQALKSQAKINYIDSLLKYKVPEEQAERFGRLVIQDEGGRMKPINTFSSELLRKVSKSDSYEGMNSDQVLLSMKQFPMAWIEIPFIYIKKGNQNIRKIIGLKPDEKYTTFKSFFDNVGNYKLSPFLDDAYKTTNPSKIEIDLIEADKKVNLVNAALFGSMLKIYPIPNDKNNKWVSNLELTQNTGTSLDTIKTAFPFYLDALARASKDKNYTMANTMVVGIEDYQKKFGSAVRPSDDKINTEILYNKYDVFKNLFWLYMLTGCLMLLLVIVAIFTQNKVLQKVITGLHISIVVLFVIHTLGLIARWYISGHAPWSDAYESMIYVGWATMFFTLAFDRKSKLTVASGTFVAAMILMIAHWNWMDPAIANLQPVLNSYWLMIHVAVIVASYGPFTLGMVLGLVSLILILLSNKENKARMELHIKEITYINELALTVGLVMLTIGNFLGGQWANESWGRYWGWDPKETWALISIMVYAFVIHARFVPALRGKWIFNLMSIIAFYSIMMTYFGVNFYLTGKHSYASGDKVVTPNEFYYSLVILAIIGTASYIKYKKIYKK
ncbi:MAG: Cytochrome c biosis protein CcsA [Bacteroidota bacterium]